MKILRSLLIITILFSVYSGFGNPAFYQKVVIRIGEKATPAEKNVAALLAERLEELPEIKTEIVTDDKKSLQDELTILLGVPENHRVIANHFGIGLIEPLSWLEPGAEGFLLKLMQEENTQYILAAGVDERGCLYAAGEFLRQIRVDENRGISVPENLNIRTAPAFEIRGTQFGQSGVSKSLAKVRDWTDKETQRVILNYALAGANTFSTEDGQMSDFLKSYGLMTQGSFGANTAEEPVPEAWNASESIGRNGYVCLSVPEAKQFMLKKCDDYFKDSPDYDFVKFFGGDGGGCECDKCNPYGLTFIKTVEEMAAIIHKYHPKTKIYFTNQKFDNEDDEAIFAYFNEQPREWAWAWGFGPGSDATTWQPGHRQTHRMDLFRYPGFGPYGIYPREILRRMPARHELVYYSEITHWKYAQHALVQMYPRPDKNGDHPPHWSHEIYERRPDQYLTMVYNRLTFYAFPTYYHRVFNDLMRYGVGDITHSSGHHDHFNQWMWQRLLWSPRTTVEDVVDEYCQTWFGPEAAPEMAKAIFLLEQNMTEQPGNPITQKTGIDEYYNLVKLARDKMPDWRMKTSWLWRMYMQKGAIDQYTKLSVIQQTEIQNKTENLVKNGKTDKQSLLEAIRWIKEISETEKMKQLREVATKLGTESNRLFGMNSEGLSNLKHDFIGLGWMQRQLERAITAKGTERKELLSMITDYENPGRGGYFDNLGTFNPAPHVEFGYPYDHGQPYVSQMLSEGNRPGQRSMHYTQDEKQGVTLRYKNLDPKAKYKIRFTFVRPWFQERYAMRMNQHSQSVYADDKLIAKDVELPLQMSDFFTYNIPAETTADGELVIRLEKAADVANGDRVPVEQWRNSGGWGTLVSEVWLLKE